MKTTIILTVALISLTIYSKAQTIPNAGFESWISPSGWYLNPENWVTNNSHIWTPVQQDTNSCTGDYALAINHDYASIKGYAKTGLRLDETPSAIKAYVKCDVYPTDKVSIEVNLYLNSQAMDNCCWTSSVSITEWTLISLPITQKYADGDSLEIIITGGDSLQTYFSVDDLSFDIISGIDTPGDRIFKLYPNPFHDKLKYELPGKLDNQLIVFEIIDIYGRTVDYTKSYTTQGELDFSGLTNGTYIVKITTDNQVLTKMGIKK